MSSEINVRRCQERIRQFVAEGNQDAGVPVSVSKFSAGIPEVIPLNEWAEIEYEDEGPSAKRTPSIQRVADALDVACDGCKSGCKVLGWLPLVTLELQPLTSPKLDYTDDPMPPAPSTSSAEVDETVELITA